MIAKGYEEEGFERGSSKIKLCRTCWGTYCIRLYKIIEHEHVGGKLTTHVGRLAEETSYQRTKHIFEFLKSQDEGVWDVMKRS